MPKVNEICKLFFKPTSTRNIFRLKFCKKVLGKLVSSQIIISLALISFPKYFDTVLQKTSLLFFYIECILQDCAKNDEDGFDKDNVENA